MRRRRWDLNPGQINGRRVLSPLRHPLLPKEGENRLGSVAKLNESISPANIKFQITPLLALIFLSDVKLVYLQCKLIHFFTTKAKLNCCNYLLRQLKCVYSLLSVRKAIADCNTMIYISWKILSFISRDPGICKYMRINSSFMRTFTYIQGILSAKILSLLNYFFL